MKPMRTLSPDEYVLLLALQADPTASFKELGDTCGFNPRKVKQLYATLLADDIVRGAYVRVNNPAIGLARYDVLVECSTLDQIDTIIKIARDHPYTQFFARYYSCFSGVFLQFAIPQGTAPIIDSLFNSLIEKGHAASFESFTSAVPCSVSTLTNVEAWNPISFEWNFQFDFFQEEFILFQEDNSSSKLRREPYVFPPVVESQLSDLSLFDIILLREMTIDITRSQAQITQDIINHNSPTARDPTTYSLEVIEQTNTSRVSRRRKYLEENHLIQRPILNYNPSYLNLFNDWLVIAHCTKELAETFLSFFSPDGIIEKSVSQYVNHHFPFASRITYFPDSESLTWYVRTPPKETSSFHRFVYDIFNSPYIVSLDSDDNKFFWFYHENFIPETSSWKKSLEWLADNILKSVEK
ncbi:MAG: hypothetical protein ACTSYA_08880 [Candidatus Kariarchaeaceae archaeon]